MKKLFSWYADNGIVGLLLGSLTVLFIVFGGLYGFIFTITKMSEVVNPFVGMLSGVAYGCVAYWLECKLTGRNK